MSISTDYPHPVNVNGYSCKNCTDVDYAKKHIDPAHPKAGPYGVNAASDPSTQNFIQFGGALKDVPNVPGSIAAAPASATGQNLNIVA